MKMMKASMRLLQCIATTATLVLASAQRPDTTSAVITGDVMEIPQGRFQYHFHDSSSASSSSSQSCCDSVVMINVGTGMSVQDYGGISRQIVQQDDQRSIVAIVLDSNPSTLMKQDEVEFANLANAIASDLTHVLPTCCTRQPKNGYLIGGHSSGGQAAFDALALSPTPGQPESLLTFHVAGFLGLAPFSIDPAETKISAHPTLVWDFSKPTCFVAPEKAGMAAYQASDSTKRIFYQVQTSNVLQIAGPHCSFADRACAGVLCGGAPETRKWIHKAVGQSVSRFFKLVPNAAYFTKDEFIEGVDLEVDTILFVNEDAVGQEESEPGIWVTQS